MSKHGARDRSCCPEAKLPRRDWILLPMLSLLTICAISISVELISRKMFSVSRKQVEDCMVFKGPSVGIRGIPGCVCWEKTGESQPVEYRFNSSGYRAQADFGPKNPEIYRIVMVGSSFGMGARVSIENSISSRLAPEISNLDGRKIEIYNQALVGRAGSPQNVALRFNDALAATPDLILWTLTPYDIRNATDVGWRGKQADGEQVRLMKVSLARKSIKGILSSFSGIQARLVDSFTNHTRSGFMLRHFLYESQYQSVASTLHEPDDSNGYLKSELSEQWQTRLRESANLIAAVEQRAKAAGVPLVVVLLPFRVQAAMISMGSWPPGYDPYKFDTEIRSIVQSNGVTYIDILPAFRTISNPEQYYFPADSHPKADGNAILARLLAEKLTSGVIPLLKANDLKQIQQAALTRER